MQIDVGGSDRFPARTLDPRLASASVERGASANLGAAGKVGITTDPELTRIATRLGMIEARLGVIDSEVDAFISRIHGPQPVSEGPAEPDVGQHPSAIRRLDLMLDRIFATVTSIDANTSRLSAIA